MSSIFFFFFVFRGGYKKKITISGKLSLFKILFLLRICKRFSYDKKKNPYTEPVFVFNEEIASI